MVSVITNYVNYKINAMMHRIEWGGLKWTNVHFRCIGINSAVYVARDAEYRMHFTYYLMSASKSNYHGNASIAFTLSACVSNIEVLWGVNLCRFESCSRFIISTNMRTCQTPINNNNNLNNTFGIAEHIDWLNLFCECKKWTSAAIDALNYWIRK